MKNQVGSTRIDTILKMLAISFVSLFAFCVGVFIGKQMSDSDYQLKALESDFNKKKVHAKTEEHPEDAIADEEVAALSEKYMNSEKDERSIASTGASAGGHGHTDDHGADADGSAHDAHGEHDAPAAHAPASHAKTGAHGKDAHGKAPVNAKKVTAPVAVGHEEDHGSHSDQANHAPVGKGKTPSTAGFAKPDLSAAHKAAARVANNVAPTEAAKPTAPTSRLPNSLPKTVGATAEIEFTVQVASYPTAEAAKEHATELVQKGFPAFPVEATIGGRTWYRVSVGSFKSSKEATSYRAQLLRQAELPSAIIQRIQR